MTKTNSAIPQLILNDGHVMPQLGYGVWLIPDDAAAECVLQAFDAGYRSIDTAMIYDNERGVGAAIRESGIAREDVFITTKLWNSDHLQAAAAFEQSIDRLGLEYLDLYLIHWPAPQTGDFLTAWRSLVSLRESGRVRSIGVSNFNIAHLEAIVADTGITPTINQVELHPNFQQKALRSWCADHGVVVEAWSPLGRGGSLLQNPVMNEIGERHGKTPAQVALRWNLQIGVVTIPKSATPARIVENLQVTDFELSNEDMDAIAQLDDPNGRLGPDPLTAPF